MNLPYIAVYCPFPGVIPNGRVLLVGYMGMYDYRPYVKKVTNNRQIMYECHRHFTLVDGPPGATCVDGQWSPKKMPKYIRRITRTAFFTKKPAMCLRNAVMF
ncbi:protein lev-9 [Trichonephila clavipes]|nr:protein lev-9 [Trichonephila clavipes]